MTKLNQTAFSDLREIMEEEFSPLLELYIKDSDSRIEELTLHLEAADYESLRQTVHSFKGASSNICAVELSQQAQKIEDAVKEQRTDGLSVAIDALKTEYLSVREELMIAIKNSNS